MSFIRHTKFGIFKTYENFDFSRIQTECGKMQTRITPSIDTFHAVLLMLILTFAVVAKIIMRANALIAMF